MARSSSSSSSRVLTGHNEIQQWAEERGAKPACVSRTGQGDIGMIRLEFPGAPNANDSNLEEISWDDFFGKFDSSNLALLVQDELAGGGQSNFNKLVGRETATAAGHGEKTSRRASRGQGTAKGRSTSAKTSAKKTSAKKTSAKKTSAKKSTKSATSRPTVTKKATAGKKASSKKAGKKTASKRAPVKSSASAKRSASSRSGGRNR